MYLKKVIKGSNKKASEEIWFLKVKDKKNEKGRFFEVRMNNADNKNSDQSQKNKKGDVVLAI